MMRLINLSKRMTGVLLSALMAVSVISVQAYAEVIEIDPTTPTEERVVGNTNDPVSVTTEYGDHDDNVDASVGNITSADDEHVSLYVESQNGKTADVIAGNIVSNTNNALGTQSSHESKTKVTVNGNIDSKGWDGVSSGVSTESSTVIKVNGDVSGANNGISIMNGSLIHDGGTYDMTVDGHVNGGPDHNTCGIYMLSYYGDNMITITKDVEAGGNGINALVFNGTATINVGGDISAFEGAGVYAYAGQLFGEGEMGKVDIHVDGTIEGGTVGIGLMRADPEKNKNITVTAWKIEPTELDGVTSVVGSGYYDFGRFVPDPEFEKTINYIIKIEQTEGAALSAKASDGSTISDGAHEGTAHEGDTVRLKIDLQPGYELLGAYNGKGEKVEIVPDGNGDYYVVVPKGGGVYLTVSVGKKYLPPQPVTITESSEAPAGASLYSSIAQMITEAGQGATVRVTITDGLSLCKAAVDALEAREDITLVVDYAYNGRMFEAVIPGGDNRPDLKQYKNAAGGIDFDALTVHFGGVQVY